LVAKGALTRFRGITFDARLTITAEELRRNGREMDVLIDSLDPQRAPKSELRDKLWKKINVRFEVFPRQRPNRVELLGENNDVLLVAKEAIFNFLAGIGDTTGTEKVKIAEPLYG
jgi:hypothetical protein